MSKEVEIKVPTAKGGNNRPKDRRKEKPIGASNAQNLLISDLEKNPEAVLATTQALINEGFLPARQLLDPDFIDDDLYECISRLDKKDAGTKLRALSDFQDLIASKTPEKLTSTRTFWARLFVNFLSDDDPRVREAALKCQEIYVRILKKEFLPVLKTVVGTWWLAQFQMNSAVSSAAKSSFSTSFPEEKRAIVLKMAWKEITSLLRRRVTSKTDILAGDAANRKTEDQRQEIAEAIDAIRGLVQAATDDVTFELQSFVTELLDKPEIWKISKTDDPRIRQRFFMLLRAFWEKLDDHLTPYLKQSVGAVIANLHDSDIKAAVATWDLLLLLLSKREDIFNYVDVQKVFLPKFIAFLRNGGFGTASSTYPSVIVVIDKLPVKSADLLDQVLAALVKGMNHDSMRGPDVTSVCRTICDIFNYALKKNLSPDTLIQNHFIPLVNDILFGTGNSVRGSEIIFGMLFKWMKKDPESSARKLCDEVWMSLSDKLRDTTIDINGVLRIQQWIVSLGSGQFQPLLDGMLREHPAFQGFLFQVFQLCFNIMVSSPDHADAKPLLAFLKSNRSSILYERLRDSFSDAPIDQSAAAFILSKLSLNPKNHIHIEIFSFLIGACQLDLEGRELLKNLWSRTDDKVDMVKLLVQHSDPVKIKQIIDTDEIVSLLDQVFETGDLRKLSDVFGIVSQLVDSQELIETSILPRIGRLASQQQLMALKEYLLKCRIQSLSTTGHDAVMALTVPLIFQPSSGKEHLDILALLGKHLLNEHLDFEKAFGKEFRSRWIQLEPLSGSVQIAVERVCSLLSGASNQNALQGLTEHFCNSFEVPRLTNSIFDRKDIFACRINALNPDESLGLDHGFMDDEVRFSSNVGVLFRGIFSRTPMSKLTFERRSEVELHIRLIFSYLDLDCIAQAEDLRRTVDGYKTLLQPSSFTHPPEVLGLLRSVGDTEIWKENAGTFAQKPAHELDDAEMITAYAGLWKALGDAEPEITAYRNDVRDRLEINVAFLEYPKTSAALRQVPWTTVQQFRLAPSLLSERIVDTSYSGPVLDVFGAAIIDWISFLVEEERLEDNPKLLVLAEEAIEAVGNILKAAGILKDTGLLWIELTEFSLPRILASLLAAVVLIGEQNIDTLLSKKHPLFVRLVVRLCSGLVDFAEGMKGALRIVWETLHKTEFGLPDRIQDLKTSPKEQSGVYLQLLAPLLLHKVHHFQITAGELLTNLLADLPPTCELEQPMDADLEKNQEGPELSPPMEIVSVLEETQDMIDHLCEQVPLGQSFGGVLPETDSYNYLLAYFLSWRIIFSWIRKESTEARQALSRYLMRTGSFGGLMDCLSRFLPLDNSANDVHLDDAFSSFLRRGYPTVNDFEMFSTQVFTEALEIMPNLARSWFSPKQGSLARDLIKFTSTNISPVLVQKELAMVADLSKALNTENFKVTVRPSVYEITAEYRVEVWVAELIVRIPKDYPLSNVQVSWGSAKGNMDAWDQWIIKLSAYLRKRNGSILDGIMEWKRSVDKKFSDTSACSICLSIVDTKTSDIPRMQCKTCRNKFHSECLNRWFREQIDPTCPLCREKFFS